MTTPVATLPDPGDSGTVPPTPPTPATPAPEPGVAGAWVNLVLTVLTRAYRAFLLTLVVIALLPLVWGWTSYVVRSGSMAPAIERGDVVVARSFGGDEAVPVGRVMVFENPARPETSELLVHRVVEYLGHDSFVTAGDANATTDATPVPRAAFRARALILVPYVGLPLVWLRGSDLWLLLGWLLLTVAAFVRASRTGRRRPPAGEPDGPPHDPGGHLRRRPVLGRLLGPRRTPRSHVHARSRVTGAAPLLATALVVAGLGTGPGSLTATSAFTDTTANSSSSWTAGSFEQPYNEAVLADAPWAYYLVDEAGGSAAADRSGNNRTGIFAAIAGYRLPGALPNNPGYAVGLGATTGRLVAGGPATTDPTTFSLELWFRTTTTRGGKLIGFERTQDETGGAYDRHVFMRDDGRLVYGGWAAPQVRTISSVASYNDGSWHHLVLTAVPHGQQQDAVMYVDGAAVAAGTTTRTGFYAGWWRAGYGSLPVGAGYPTSRAFDGSIDQVAIYRTSLSAARVAAHYSAR
jgi:signal peptidase I